MSFWQQENPVIQLDIFETLMKSEVSACTEQTKQRLLQENPRLRSEYLDDLSKSRKQKIFTMLSSVLGNSRAQNQHDDAIQEFLLRADRAIDTFDAAKADVDKFDMYVLTCGYHGVREHVRKNNGGSGGHKFLKAKFNASACSINTILADGRTHFSDILQIRSDEGEGDMETVIFDTTLQPIQQNLVKHMSEIFELLYANETKSGILLKCHCKKYNRKHSSSFLIQEIADTLNVGVDEIRFARDFIARFITRNPDSIKAA